MPRQQATFSPSEARNSGGYSPYVAVIGGGAFGVTSALKLSRDGCAVDLFEKSSGILQGASGINQYRLHHGYHYPRSPETARSCLNSEGSFREEYGDAVLDHFEHYYCVARQGSKTSPEQFAAFCEAQSLEITPARVDLLRHENLSLCVAVNEGVFDPDALRKICWSRLRTSQVNVLLNTDARGRNLDRYDYVVVSTYSAINDFLSDDSAQTDYQYELCEKPVVRLPDEFQNKSVVVMDGPFMCVDPLGNSGLFVLGNVVHAIHETNVGRRPIIDKRYLPLLNNGMVKDPPITNFAKFISSASEFFEGIEKADHVGSMFTIRTVLPDKDETDERPTIVERAGDRLIKVFSGKIGTCVEAAEQVSRMVLGERLEGGSEGMAKSSAKAES